MRHMRYAEGRPTLYQEDEEKHSSRFDIESGSKSSDQEIQYDIMLGLRIFSRRNEPRKCSGSQ